MVLAAYRSMAPAERVAMAGSLAEEARAVALAGLARRRPELTEPERAQELARLLRHADGRRRRAVR